jgi:hypothetical protein
LRDKMMGWATPSRQNSGKTTRINQGVSPMSSIGAVAGSNPAWIAQAAQAANQAVKPVDRDGDNDTNKPDTAQAASRNTGAATRMLDIKA